MRCPDQLDEGHHTNAGVPETVPGADTMPVGDRRVLLPGEEHRRLPDAALRHDGTQVHRLRLLRERGRSEVQRKRRSHSHPGERDVESLDTVFCSLLDDRVRARPPGGKPPEVPGRQT